MLQLPQIEHPYFDTILPISGIKIKYRPYLVKEQKIILISKDSKDPKEKIGSVLQVIKSCTSGQFDAESLNSIDIAFLIAKIRSAAEGSHVEVLLTCGKCKHKSPAMADLETMKLSKEYDPKTSKIMLSGDIGVQLRIPNIDILALTEEDGLFGILPSIIETIFDADSVYKLEDFPQTEQDEFIENLSNKNVEDITEFMNNVPKLKVDIPFTCEACGNNEIVVVEDIQDFLS